MDVSAIFTALLRNRSRWNLDKSAYWPSRCYVLGLLSEGRSVRLGEFFLGGNMVAFLPLRAPSEPFRATYARYSKVHVVSKAVRLYVRATVSRADIESRKYECFGVI